MDIAWSSKRSSRCSGSAPASQRQPSSARRHRLGKPRLIKQTVIFLVLLLCFAELDTAPQARLVAFVTPQKGASSPTELPQSFAAKTLPDHMVPHHVFSRGLEAGPSFKRDEKTP